VTGVVSADDEEREREREREGGTEIARNLFQLLFTNHRTRTQAEMRKVKVRAARLENSR